MERNIVLEAVTGSKAYGLDHANSDTDKMGVFVAPTIKVAGLRWNSSSESWSDAGPEGDDTTYHEIGKFLRLTLKSNPTLIELYFMEEYDIIDEVGKGLLDLREHVLHTDGIRRAYHAYAQSQIRRVFEDYPDHKPKMARHALRIARQGCQLLFTGALNVRVDDPQEYFDLDYYSYDQLQDKLTREVSAIQTVPSILPDKPNEDMVEDFLIEVRRLNLG